MGGMYLLGHVGIALVAAAGLVALAGPRWRRGGVGTVVLVALATAPDVDLFVAEVSHRGITHTVWAGLVLGGVLGLVSWGVASRRGRPAGPDARFYLALGVGCVLVHLLGDVITPMGIRPFYPLVETSYTLDLVAARTPEANLGFLLVGTATFTSVRWPHVAPHRLVWATGGRGTRALAGATGRGLAPLRRQK